MQTPPDMTPMSSRQPNLLASQTNSRPAYRQAVADIHALLYNTADRGGAVDGQDVEEIVSELYDIDAVYENPVTTARGRARITDHFAMLALLPGSVQSEIQDVCESHDFSGNRSVLLSHVLNLRLHIPMLGPGYTAASALLPTLSRASSFGHSRATSVATATTLHQLRGPSEATSGRNTPADSDAATPTPGDLARTRLTSCASWMDFYYGPDATVDHGSELQSYATTPAATPGQNWMYPQADFDVQSYTHPHHPPRDPPGSAIEVEDDDKTEDGRGCNRPRRRPLPSYQLHLEQPLPSGDADSPEDAESADLSANETATPFLVSKFTNRLPIIPTLLRIPGRIYSRMPSIPRPTLSLQLRITTRLDFNDSQHIYHHEDHYSVKDVVSAVPVLGSLYTAERVAFSLCAGFVCRWLVSVADTNRQKKPDPMQSQRDLREHRSAQSMSYAATVADLPHYSRLNTYNIRSASGTSNLMPFPTSEGKEAWAPDGDGRESGGLLLDLGESFSVGRIRQTSNNSTIRSSSSSFPQAGTTPSPTRSRFGLGSMSKSKVAAPKTSRGLSYMGSREAALPVMTSGDESLAHLGRESAVSKLQALGMQPKHSYQETAARRSDNVSPDIDGP